MTSLKYYCFRTMAFDFGIFVQIFWHSIHGNFMFTQPRGSPLHPTTFLAVHFSPLLVSMIPIYALLPSPYLLMVIQSVALALPSYYVYRIGVEVTGDEGLSLLYAVGYLLYPGTLWSNWYDFHLESFVPLFTSMAYYHYLTGSRYKLALSLFLLLITFERAVFIIFAFAGYVFIREKYLRRKAETESRPRDAYLNPLLLLVLVISIFYFFGSEAYMSVVWPEKTILQPARIFGRLSYEDFLVKTSYLALLSAPLAFLSLNSPLELLPALPYLFLSMTTDYRPYFTIPWQYPALVSIPFCVSAIFGGSTEDHGRIRLKLVASMALCFVLAAPASPLMSRFSSRWALPIPTGETHLRQRSISTLESDATVLAQENVFPNVAERETAYTLWPSHLEPPDYILFDVLELLFYHEPLGNTTRDAVFRFMEREDYGVLSNVNGFIVLKRGYNGPSTTLSPLSFSLEFEEARKPFVAFEDAFPETRFFVPSHCTVERDHMLVEEGVRGGVWWGPYVTLPPGNYSVEVHLRVDEASDEPILTIIVYWYKHAYYYNATVLGSDIEPGRINVLRFGFELEDWSPSLEVVGVSHGNAEFRIYGVEVEGTP